MPTASIPSSRKKQLKKLAHLMSQQNEMYTPPIGPVLDLLDYDVTNDELDLLIRLGTRARSVDEIAALWDMPVEECRDKVDQFISRGFIWGEVESKDPDRLELAPIVVGWLELQLLGAQTEEKSMEFAHRLENLFAAMKKLNFFPLRNISNKLTPKMTKPCQTIGTIPVGGSRDRNSVIEIQQNVAYGASSVFPIQDAYELVDRCGTDNQVAVLKCFCRKWRRMMDDPCRFDLPRESCIVVGPAVDHMLDYGFEGRKIEKSDALKLLEELAKGGVVHTLFHERDNITMPNAAVCNCCWDCCGIYGGYNRGAIPMYFKANHIARLADPESCKACSKCVKHCPTGAISLADDRPELREKLCIGCGQCALQCPVNSFTLEPSPRDVFVPLLKKSETRA